MRFVGTVLGVLLLALITGMFLDETLATTDEIPALVIAKDYSGPAPMKRKIWTLIVVTDERVVAVEVPAEKWASVHPGNTISIQRSRGWWTSREMYSYED